MRNEQASEEARKKALNIYPPSPELVLDPVLVTDPVLVEVLHRECTLDCACACACGCACGSSLFGTLSESVKFNSEV
jgi:hypothetical protein